MKNVKRLHRNATKNTGKQIYTNVLTGHSEEGKTLLIMQQKEEEEGFGSTPSDRAGIERVQVLVGDLELGHGFWFWTGFRMLVGQFAQLCRC